MALTSWLDSMFSCPSCDELFFCDSSVVYSDLYGDSICWRCEESLEQEQKSQAGDNHE